LEDETTHTHTKQKKIGVTKFVTSIHGMIIINMI
jgi:hypothetical protein